ncbi:hypothetical protein RvY_08286-1 [Ramazzottius varieornatus]|uniref:Uncharacterized protein n=1 Tax=Ramazzottius varieornatus TaxID=947166 RepID=A0A1D1VB15_RAMVA|nr:hypothetical protein RvY_08286-1 [Ramazzottius varieornatus]
MDIEALSLATPAYSSFFERKRILVTGGAKDIGRGIAVKLAELDAEVFVLDNCLHDLNKLKEYTDYWGHSNIHTERIDLTDWNATSRLIASHLSTWWSIMLA